MINFDDIRAGAEHRADELRGRVRALWIVGVPVPTIAKELGQAPQIVAMYVRELADEDRLAGHDAYLAYQVAKPHGSR